MSDAPPKTNEPNTNNREKAITEKTKTTIKSQRLSSAVRRKDGKVDHSRVDSSVVVLFIANLMLRKSRERLSFC